MANWSQDATEYLDGYLKQVAALARRQGDDADDIVSGLRDHIAHEVENIAGDTIEIDTLLEVLATTGTPEEVVNLDTPLRGPSRPATTTQRTSPPPPPIPAPQAPQAQLPQQIVVKHRSWSSCAIATLIFTGLAVLLISIIGIIAAIVVPNLLRSREASMTHARESARRANCANNLKQVGLNLLEFAHDHDENLPPLSDQPGRLMFAPDALYPDYLDNLTFFICPSDSTSVVVPASGKEGFIDDHSYFYISHAITNDEEGLAYVAAYQKAANAGNGFDHDFTMPDGTILPRIQENLADDRTADQGGRIPIMIDRIDNHIPAGGNVFFLSGRVEFIKLNAKFPMTDTFMDALNTIDQ